MAALVNCNVLLANINPGQRRQFRDDWPAAITINDIPFRLSSFRLPL